jgi:hypothetical protein
VSYIGKMPSHYFRLDSAWKASEKPLILVSEAIFNNTHALFKILAKVKLLTNDKSIKFIQTHPNFYEKERITEFQKKKFF